MRQVDTDKVRQGRWGYQVLMVLVGGLLLAGIAWAAAEYYGEAIDPPTSLENAPTAPSPADQPAPNAPPAN
ncbi:MAG TPA: hypothetical protein VIU14_14670 [Mesorhizobium sp.]|jgi:hypothetical protein